MSRFGLIGFPLTHSFSYKYFDSKFTNEGLDDHSYINYEIENINDIHQIIEDNEDLKGLNITIPYKESIIPLLDELDETARKVGAVNTIKITRNKGVTHLKGFNTDVLGFKESLKPILKGHQHKVLILGTGGASKAVDYVFKELGLDTLFVSRTPIATNQVAYKDLNKAALDIFKVIVNTSPLGTYPDTNNCPDIPYKYLSKDHLLYDLVYNPEVTLFMQKGNEQGAVTRNGYAMLELQAEAAWRIWNS